MTPSCSVLKNASDILDILVCTYPTVRILLKSFHYVFSGCGTLIFVSWPMPQCVQKLRPFAMKGPDNPTNQLLPKIKQSGSSGTEKKERRREMAEDQAFKTCS